MPTLTDEQKHEITVALATFVRPVEIREMLKEEYGLDVEATQIVRYNPTKASFEGSDELRVIFEAARERYLSEVATIPIAQKAFRLNELQRNYTKAVKAGNLSQAAALLKQAAEEEGGLYSNTRNVNLVREVEFTADERRQRLASIIDESFGRNAPKPTAPSVNTEQ